MNKPTRQEQVKALLLIHNIPVFHARTARRPGGLANSMNSGDPFILVSEYRMSSDVAEYWNTKPTILIELRGLGGGFNVLDQDVGIDDPFDRTDIIERFVNKLDNRKLGRLSQMLCNLASNT